MPPAKSSDCLERGSVTAIAARQLPDLTGVRVLRVPGPEVPLGARVRTASWAAEARGVAARPYAELTPAAAQVAVPLPQGQGQREGWLPRPGPLLPSRARPPFLGPAAN